MTNKELQDKLRKFPDDMEVKIEVDEYFYAKCASPHKVQRRPLVLLEPGCSGHSLLTTAGRLPCLKIENYYDSL